MDRKEAIEVVRKKVDYYEADKRLKAALEALIPELTESEDEKNWKAVLGYVKDDALRVWLEKQKDQKPAEWTDADEKILERIIDRLKFVIPVPAKDPVGVTFERREDAEAINWLKRRVTSQPHPKQEWSEEDERIRKNICRIVKQHMRHCAAAGIGTGDHREALQYLEKQGEHQSAEWTGYSGIVIDKTKYSELTDAEWAILRGFTRVTGLSHFPITIIKETAKDFLAQQPAEWSEEDERILKRLIRDYDEAVRSDNGGPWGKVFQENLAWLKSRRPQPNNNLRWRRATDGANIPESIIIPDGEEPRFGKCAVKNSYYIPVEELKNLPKDES